jgi:hypothetical protein
MDMCIELRLLWQPMLLPNKIVENELCKYIEQLIAACSGYYGAYKAVETDAIRMATSNSARAYDTKTSASCHQCFSLVCPTFSRKAKHHFLFMKVSVRKVFDARDSKFNICNIHSHKLYTQHIIPE